MVTFTSGPSNGLAARFALRGVARNDRLYPASEILATVLDSRIKNNLGELKAAAGFVENEAHVLPGTVIFGLDLTNELKELPSANVVSMMLARPVTQEEFAAAKGRKPTKREIE